ncbi:MAG: aspartate-semialdehyde dehydrogenase, partial [Burkholderiales bacterium 21-58-4]
MCHSPTGYGLKTTIGESAGTQAFDSVMYTDVVILLGANPSAAHPVFASRLKRRLREGARLIVIDPRATELVNAPHVKADYHLPVRPGTNAALLTALAHVIATEGLIDEAFVAARCELKAFEEWRNFVSLPENSPEATQAITGVRADDVRGAARLYATGGNAAIYYGLGVTEHSQGSTAVMAIANLAMATGNVGREMLSVLAERAFPASEVVALASTRSVGTEVSFGDATLKVKALDYYDFKGTDICLMSAGGKVSKEWSPKIAAAGSIVIDNSSQWRMDRQVPLIVPEVNAAALNDGIPKGIIANPNCSTAQLVVALKPLHDLAKIKRLVVATYQSVSGAGKAPMDELFRQTRAVFVADPIEVKFFTKQIAFNVIPHIDVFLDSGYTKEE